LAPVLERNINALYDRQQQTQRAASWQDRLADAITQFSGSMNFVYLHLVAFGCWIIVNLGWIAIIPAWDPSFVVLAMIASVEAIFLSTFVLISQNRMVRASEKRSELDLQISLLAEHEITKLATIVSAIAQKLEIRTPVDEELHEIKQDVAPDTVLDEIERRSSQPH
jgi:uncharacterized membrane protein